MTLALAPQLLPDQVMPQPVLVIGLEVTHPLFPPFPAMPIVLQDCLAHTEWTREHGHRHMKRPGTDAFLT